MDRILKYKVAIVMLFLFLLLFTACQTQDEFRKTGTHWTVGFDKREIVPEDITAKTYYIAVTTLINLLRYIGSQYVRAVWMDDNSDEEVWSWQSLTVSALLGPMWSIFEAF